MKREKMNEYIVYLIDVSTQICVVSYKTNAFCEIDVYDDISNCYDMSKYDIEIECLQYNVNDVFV